MDRQTAEKERERLMDAEEDDAACKADVEKSAKRNKPPKKQKGMQPASSSLHEHSSACIFNMLT